MFHRLLSWNFKSTWIKIIVPTWCLRYFDSVDLTALKACFSNLTVSLLSLSIFDSSTFSSGSSSSSTSKKDWSPSSHHSRHLLSIFSMIFMAVLISFFITLLWYDTRLVTGRIRLVSSLLTIAPGLKSFIYNVSRVNFFKWVFCYMRMQEIITFVFDKFQQIFFTSTCDSNVIQPRLKKPRSGAGSEIATRLKPS